MTTNELTEKAQVLFRKINNSYLELRKLYGFYDTDIWEGFARIHSSEAEETIERLASVVPGMDANSLYCFKLIFDWIEAAKNQVEPVDPKYKLPKKIEQGKQYRIISPSREWYEFYIEDGTANMNLAVPFHTLEGIVSEWEKFIKEQKEQVDLLCYRLGI